MLRIYSFSILCSITVFQILLISFYLFIKRKGSTVNKALIVALLVTWAVFITGSFLLLAPSLKLITYDFAHLLNLAIFLAAPILYIHFKSLFHSGYKINSKELLIHSIPFILIFAYLFNYIVIEGKTKYVFYPTAIYLISFLFLQNILYFYLMLKEIKTVPETNGNRAKLKLFRFLLRSALVIFSIKLVLFIVWNILRYNDICIFITGIFFVIVFIIINSFVIFSLNNPDQLLGTAKYQSSNISHEELPDYLSKVSNYLSTQKSFVDPLLSLERLSKSTKIQEKLLSQIINQSSGLNFNDFINRYRIEYAQELFREDSSKKVLEVAFECGFNSKTTFNSAFKKFTGITPSIFKKKLSLQDFHSV